MTLSERIKVAMQTTGMNQVELARACGVKPPSVNGWLSGKSKFLRGENLLKAARALRVSEEWLATGKGSMIPEVGAPGPVSQSPFINDDSGYANARPVRVGSAPNTVSVPRVKLRLRAGIADFQTEADMTGDGHIEVPHSVLVALHLKSENLLAVSIRGTSMEPMMFEDDLVVIDRSDIKPINREIYAINFDGEACVKQLIFRGGQWYLHSLNPDHKPVNVRAGQCSIVGRVVYQPGRVVTGRL